MVACSIFRMIMELLVVMVVAAVVAADSFKEDTFYYLRFLQPHISAIIYFLLPLAYSKLTYR
jgi:hypothetical protein